MASPAGTKSTSRFLLQTDHQRHRILVLVFVVLGIYRSNDGVAIASKQVQEQHQQRQQQSHFRIIQKNNHENTAQGASIQHPTTDKNDVLSSSRYLLTLDEFVGAAKIDRTDATATKTTTTTTTTTQSDGSNNNNNKDNEEYSFTFNNAGMNPNPNASGPGDYYYIDNSPTKEEEFVSTFQANTEGLSPPDEGDVIDFTHPGGYYAHEYFANYNNGGTMVDNNEENNPEEGNNADQSTTQHPFAAFQPLDESVYYECEEYLNAQDEYYHYVYYYDSWDDTQKRIQMEGPCKITNDTITNNKGSSNNMVNNSGKETASNTTGGNNSTYHDISDTYPYHAHDATEQRKGPNIEDDYGHYRRRRQQQNPSNRQLLRGHSTDDSIRTIPNA